ncbi:unnamed protein product [Brassicogethes aeneus]|uniref:Uncharacterized protein n=1 Tax=Brassicogethes aeneus TaxID=1431903 RepID=A0A9P0B0N2_BRAAE|nr:unnamed protein product [Brassicogethes aeneus]
MEDTIGFVIVMGVILFLTILIRQYLKYEKEKFLREVNAQRQQDEIYNISGRVQGQNSEQRLPSDAYLTVEHITASNQLNKPSYNDEPPSYEEAIKLASHLPPPPVLPPVYTGIYDRPSVHVTSPVSPTVTIAIS